MSLVIKRKLRQTWREAVARRAGPEADACLAEFDGLVAAGRNEAEAAFRVLDRRQLLWRLDEPGGTAPPRDPAASPE